MPPSLTLSQMTDAPVIDPKVRLFNYLDMDGKSNHCCGTVQCGGDAFNWATENLLSGDANQSIAISQVENMARQIAPGASGHLFCGHGGIFGLRERKPVRA